jgi:hypothetical protein
MAPFQISRISDKICDLLKIMHFSDISCYALQSPPWMTGGPIWERSLYQGQLHRRNWNIHKSFVPFSSPLVRERDLGFLRRFHDNHEGEFERVYSGLRDRRVRSAEHFQAQFLMDCNARRKSRTI